MDLNGYLVSVSGLVFFSKESGDFWIGFQCFDGSFFFFGVGVACFLFVSDFGEGGLKGMEVSVADEFWEVLEEEAGKEHAGLPLSANTGWVLAFRAWVMDPEVESPSVIRTLVSGRFA